jgi:hypothetical protein
MVWPVCADTADSMPGKTPQQLAATTYWGPQGLLLHLPIQAEALGPARCAVVPQSGVVVIQQAPELPVTPAGAGAVR